MKTRLIILSAFLLLQCSFLSAQKILTIDLDSIKSIVSDTSSRQYYPLLIDKMVKFDTTLTANDYKLIYYGYVFQPNYNPYSTADREFVKLYNDKQFEKALEIGEKVLEENPVDIGTIFKMAICHYALKNEDIARNYAHNFSSLIREIYKSGDGESIETAYVVISVADEYAILRTNKLQLKSQSLINGTDVLTLETNENSDVEKLYFNVQIPLIQMSKMFGE